MQSTDIPGSNQTAGQIGHPADTMADQASAGLSRLSDTAQQTMERFTHAASDAASRLGDRGEALLHGPAAEKTRAYMREHPLATIGIAVAVGLVLSRLLSRR